jgi:hypothetical protein
MYSIDSDLVHDQTQSKPEAMTLSRAMFYAVMGYAD